MMQNRSLKVGKPKIMGHISNFKRKMHYILYFEEKKLPPRGGYMFVTASPQENLDFSHVALRERRFPFGTALAHRWVWVR
jgi:hypothetical protein